MPKLSVAENLLLGREPRRRGIIDRAALKASARRALTRVGLEVDPDARVEELGIGQQQMVEIARALEKNAAILVLDEPTAALADRDAGRLFDLLRELRRSGVSSVYISHRLEEVLPLADRVTVLRDGRTVTTAVGPSREEVIRWMVGRDVRDLYPRAPRPRGAASRRRRRGTRAGVCRCGARCRWTGCATRGSCTSTRHRCFSACTPTSPSLGPRPLRRPRCRA